MIINLLHSIQFLLKYAFSDDSFLKVYSIIMGQQCLTFIELCQILTLVFMRASEFIIVKLHLGTFVVLNVIISVLSPRAYIGILGKSVQE